VKPPPVLRPSTQPPLQGLDRRLVSTGIADLANDEVLLALSLSDYTGFGGSDAGSSTVVYGNDAIRLRYRKRDRLLIEMKPGQGLNKEVVASLTAVVESLKTGPTSVASTPLFHHGHLLQGWWTDGTWLRLRPPPRPDDVLPERSLLAPQPLVLDFAVQESQADFRVKIERASRAMNQLRPLLFLLLEGDLDWHDPVVRTEWIVDIPVVRGGGEPPAEPVRSALRQVGYFNDLTPAGAERVTDLLGPPPLRVPAEQYYARQRNPGLLELPDEFELLLTTIGVLPDSDRHVVLRAAAWLHAARFSRTTSQRIQAAVSAIEVLVDADLAAAGQAHEERQLGTAFKATLQKYARLPESAALPDAYELRSRIVHGEMRAHSDTDYGWGLHPGQMEEWRLLQALASAGRIAVINWASARRAEDQAPH
jgi:hypothetical protein